MSNRSTDDLFQLIKSLKKFEKRNFKLFAKRHSDAEDLKSIILFDALDDMDKYDEDVLLNKYKELKKQQLSNLKSGLYKQILSSLRSIKNENSIHLQLHDQLAHARILYNKGLYLQSLKTLAKLKEQATEFSQWTFVNQALTLEKEIESLHITRSFEGRAEQLAKEVYLVNNRLSIIGRLSNLNLQLYGWYIANGHARNEKDEKKINNFFKYNLPFELVGEGATLEGFYESLYYYSCHSWYAFIRQDFLSFYRYVHKSIDLFHKQPAMMAAEEGMYIKSLHNLAGAHFFLGNSKKLNLLIQHFEELAASKHFVISDNAEVQTFVYMTLSKIDKHFLEGTFSEGIKLVASINEKLQEYEMHLDTHRILVFYYKIACLYFGGGENEKAIHYLNKVINWKTDLRTDIQCYARLLNLIAHYELKHYDLLEYLLKSVYRFMAKMGGFSLAEKEIMEFLRKAFDISPNDSASLKKAYKNLLDKLKNQELNRFEKRAFIYLDLISWLESKIENVPVQLIVHKKFEVRELLKTDALMKITGFPSDAGLRAAV